MSLETILFYVFGSVAAVAAVLMITRSNAVISALFLILNMASLAGLYLILNAQFIAVAQVIVYAGAIMVLFLFVLMLLKPENERKFMASSPNVKIFTIFIAAIVFFQIAYMIFLGKPSSLVAKDVDASVQAGTIEEIGRQLFTNYVLPFEAAGFLLLAATIGALVIAKKKFE
ncbi:MAG: NADH-quinone oxidoreductase subunit J [Ignavibacterium sp.]|nr:NADH-quinone oxidoreductase subunit J [Ignavibacterium sp.]